MVAFGEPTNKKKTGKRRICPFLGGWRGGQNYVEYAVPLTHYSNSVTVTVYGNLGAVGPLSMLLLF